MKAFIKVDPRKLPDVGYDSCSRRIRLDKATEKELFEKEQEIDEAVTEDVLSDSDDELDPVEA